MQTCAGPDGAARSVPLVEPKAPDAGDPDVISSGSCRYRVKQLPPLQDRDLLNALARELRMVPKAHREDALQVAWIAFLGKSDPRRAVNTWWQRERRYRRRHEQLPDERRA